MPWPNYVAAQYFPKTLTFLIADLPLLLPGVIRRDLQEPLDISQQGFRGGDERVCRGVNGHGRRRTGLRRVANWRGRPGGRHVSLVVTQICSWSKGYNTIRW